MFIDQKTQCYEDGNALQIDLQMQMPNRKNPSRLFAETDKFIQGKERKGKRLTTFKTKKKYKGQRTHTT